MKRTLFAAALFVASAAQASFTSVFDPSNWTVSTGTGSIGSFSAGDLSMTSGNDGSGDPSNTDVIIALPSSGTVSFRWDYTTSDSFGPFWDPFFIFDPSLVQVSDDSGGTPQGGNISFTANAGDVIGFRIRTLDNDFGAATVRISNFNFDGGTTNPAPEPGGLALLGGGLLAGLVARRKLKCTRTTA